MKKHSLIFALPALALAVLSACGGGGQKQTTTTQSQTAASPAAGAMGGGTMAGSTTNGAMVPSSLHCGATKPVWVNTKTHVYHTSSDPMYGRTKHGEYMCARTAVAQGYHAAGSSASSSSMRSGKHHKRSKGSMMAQPEPSPT